MYVQPMGNKVKQMKINVNLKQAGAARIQQSLSQTNPGWIVNVFFFIALFKKLSVLSVCIFLIGV